jgi:hypothetical protein
MKTLAQKLLYGWMDTTLKPLFSPKIKSDRYGNRNKYDRRKCKAEGKR